MQRFFDKLIGYVRTIEVAGVDVGDTEANNLAQDRDCTVVICWRPEYMRASQLHGTVAHASKDQIIGELECASWQCCRRGRLPHSFHVRVYHRKRRRWRCNATFIRNSCLILQSTGLASHSRRTPSNSWLQVVANVKCLDLTPRPPEAIPREEGFLGPKLLETWCFALTAECAQGLQMETSLPSFPSV